MLLFNSGVLGGGVKSSQNSVLASGSMNCCKSFLSTSVDSMINHLASSKHDQVEMLKGCVDAWEASGMAGSPDSDRFKELVCISYLEAYKKGWLEPNANNSSLYEFKVSFWFQNYSNLSMDEKASFNVTMSNTVSSGFSIGVKHREKWMKKQGFPAKTAEHSSSYLFYSCALLIIFIIVVLGFIYL